MIGILVFGHQKKRLIDANRLHMAAVQRKKAARQQVSHRCRQFLAEPFNLLYPYSAGILICASQLKSDTAGLKRIPFLNIAKAGVGVWTLINRIRKIKDSRPDNDEKRSSSV